MQLLDSDRQPSWNAEVVCRQSWLMALVGTVVLGLLFLLLALVPANAWMAGVLPNWAGVLLGFLALLVLWWIATILRTTFRRTNWCLAVEADGLLINLRSYRNYQLPPGQTVLQLDYQEIVSAKRHVAQVSEPSDEGPVTWREQSLDLQIDPALTDSLRQAISAERQRRSERSYFGNAIRVSGRSNHVPVTVPQEGLVRIAWRTRYDGVRPSIKKVLQRLAIRVQQIDADSAETIPDWQSAGEDQLDDMILRLIESGDILTAVKVLVDRRGYSMTEAKKFVDEVGANV